jgi:hypothetical protein
MPRVGSFGGNEIYMYFADHNPPHVHIYCAEYAASVVIATGTTLAGTMPAKQLQAAREWIDEQRATLLAQWATLNP